MKNKSLFSRLLDNKKILIIVVLVVSFLLWIISSDDISKSISDIPIEYNLSESISGELKIYSTDAETVSVDVAGKRVIVDSLSPDDFSVNIDLSSVTKPESGTYPIVVEPKNGIDVEVTKTVPSAISVMVDREASKTVNVISEFSYSPEGYYVDNNAPTSVEIIGPESIVSKVKSAYISGTVTSPIASTVSRTFDIKLYNTEDPTAKGAEEISTDYINMSIKSADITFRYLKTNEDMPFALKYSPSDIKLPDSYYTITPSTISVAGIPSMIEGNQAISSLGIDIGSLSKYKNENYNEYYSLEDILGDNFVNRSEGVEDIKVHLDFSTLSSETFDVPSSRIAIMNLPDGYKYTLPKNFPVTVIGTQTSINNIDEDSFSIVYDFTSITGTTEANVDVPVEITINSNGLCWVYRPSDTISIMLEAE